MNAEEFLTKILDYFKDEFSRLFRSNNYYLESTKLEGVFFSIDPFRKPIQIKYNPTKIKQLEGVKSNITESTIRNTGVYFANHEYTHTIKPFLKFDENWILINEDTLFFSKSANEQTYFNYKEIKYRLEDYHVDKSVDEKIIKNEILFRLFNFKQLLESMNSLKEFITSHKDIINDSSFFNTIKDILIRKKYLNNILIKAICLYGLDCGNSIKKLITEKNMKFLNGLIDPTISMIDEINVEKLKIEEIKKIMVQLFTDLENLNIIGLLSRNI